MEKNLIELFNTCLAYISISLSQPSPGSCPFNLQKDGPPLSKPQLMTIEPARVRDAAEGELEDFTTEKSETRQGGNGIIQHDLQSE